MSEEKKIEEVLKNEPIITGGIPMGVTLRVVESVPNPYGANGTTSDPREQTCWDNYVKSILEGRENAYKSAIDAGYAEDTARNITINDWFKERLRNLKRKGMLEKAEKLLDKTLTYDSEDEEGKVRTDLLRVQTDVAKHITKTLGKDEGYSERQELTGKDGKAIEVSQITGMNIQKDDITVQDQK